MNTPSTEYGANGPGNRDPEALARAIDATRGEVNQTIEALQARLSPGQIVDRTMELWRSSGGQFASNLGRSVRDNPLPIIVTGIGLAWMVAVTVRQPSAGRSDPANPGRAGSGDMADDAASAVGARLSEAAGTVSHVANSTASAAAAGAAQLSSGLRSAGSAMADQGRRISEGFADLLREQPLLVGAVGLAFGALIGYALPATEAEDRLMGQTRDSALRRVKDTASEQVASAAHAVREAAGRDPSQDGEDHPSASPAGSRAPQPVASAPPNS